ncbi:MAG TPA: hypothetical protein VMM76_15835 [Pirellulaceae bacterium]|nr:hypothetical protein [Pirellulaceae bacterium]
MYRRRLLLVFSVCFATTGCTTLTPNIGEIFSVSNNQAAQAHKNSEFYSSESNNSEFNNPALAPPPDVPSFLVEMRGTNNESQKFKRPLTEEATYVQGVLVQSNALKRFGRVKMELWRPRPDGAGYHKLDIPYDRKMKMVPPGYDYQIREGDRLVFMQDDSNILDDMFGSLGG